MTDEPPASQDCCDDDRWGDASPELHVERLPRSERPWERGALDVRPDRVDVAEPTTRIPRRWDRLARLVGDHGLRRLMRAHVTIVGLGGVGGYVAEALARSAIGRLTLVDFDDVCVTNVNRQIQAYPNTVGQSKARLLGARVTAINPDAQVEALQAFYDQSTSSALLSPRPDFVVDAIDNVTAKVHLLHTCLEQRIPVVSVSGAGARLDPTQVRVADLSETKVDPLARILRKELSRLGVPLGQGTKLPVVYSEEEVRPPEVPSWDEEQGFRCICPHREGSPHACERRRMIYGTSAFMTAAFGMAAASVAVRQLTGL